MHEGHSHDHDHFHTHDHVHEAEHSHDHAHTHHDHGAAAVAAGSMEETKALLAYMIHHNAHHAEELLALAEKLPRQAQKRLFTAVGTFDAANVELQAVLDSLG